MTIAGHTFSGLDGRCSCGKKLSDISFAAYDPHWNGRIDIAHAGALSERERMEVAMEIERVWNAK